MTSGKLPEDEYGKKVDKCIVDAGIKVGMMYFSPFTICNIILQNFYNVL